MTLEEQVVERLMQLNYTISFAESCTGGLCCGTLVNVANASRVLNASFVTYANDAKIQLLGVQESTILDRGVVSEQVAAQMAQGVAKAAESDVGVGITGIAGPGGGTPKKPVGMVCFGFCVQDQVQTCTCRFGNLGRNQVRKSAVEFVFSKLLEIL